MNYLYIFLAAISIATSSFAAPIHDHVTNLGFAAVKSYIEQGGDINLVDEITGKTPLALAIEQASPKTFELKNYPFDKRTFMFIKKLIGCGLTTGVKTIAQQMVVDNPHGNILVDGLTGNEATCKEVSESTEFACVTQEEIGEFLSQVRSDLPNCVTSVTDILAAANDFLFDNILFYEGTGQESAQLNMIKLLVQNKARIAAGTEQIIKRSANAVDKGADAAAYQSGVRVVGDLAVVALLQAAQMKIINPQGMGRYPTNAALFMLGVKWIVDVRNVVAAVVHAHLAKKNSEQLRQVIFEPEAK